MKNLFVLFVLSMAFVCFGSRVSWGNEPGKTKQKSAVHPEVILKTTLGDIVIVSPKGVTSVANFFI